MKLRILIFTLIAGVFASCESFLEEDNKSGLTADAYYSTLEGIEALVNSCYTPMRFWYGKENGIALTETGTDIFTRGNGMENPPVALYNSDLSGANDPIEFYWTRLYSALNTCNAAVERIPESPLAENLKPVRQAEARFLRAFYLWHIVETWGSVHLFTEEVKNIQETATRTPVDSFYDQIFEDLEFAVENLPPSSDDYGRANRAAAEAFLARMYLTRGEDALASRHAKNVINDYGFSLVDNYADLWDINNVRNPEIVWLVNFTADLVLNLELEHPDDDILLRDGGNNSHLFFLMTYDQLPGMTRDIGNGRPFARFMPTAHLLDLFDETIDSRFDATFQSVWYCNNLNNAPEGMQLGDTAIYATKYVIPEAEKENKPYTVIDRSRTYNNNDAPQVRDRYVSLRKFLDPSRQTISQQQGKRDAFVIRLAEMYLIIAEAEMNQGNMGDAVQYFNEVRRRAALDGHEQDMEISEGDLNIDMILDERAREFAGEQLRWFDLKRTGKLVERVQQWNPDASANIQPFHQVRPIPQSQLDAVTNKSEFTQNEGYNR
ncbi:RagB/SusD family nutrient uptake outer membrane protein [Sinomicrobium sp. M5D2P9]